MLNAPAWEALAAEIPRAVRVEAVRATLAEVRAALVGGGGGGEIPLDPDGLVVRAIERARELAAPPEAKLRAVINATGILLHTGLGRAPIGEEGLEAIREVASGYCNLEFDLETGRRGRRGVGIAALFRELTGAGAALVVNNNAAATILALRVAARDREVVVSRGQLVEIGGGFRLPEIFEVSGARLREVGTTNKTRLGDYEAAIGPETGAILRVHASNYRIVGFAAEVSVSELAPLARSRGIPLIDDLGSGKLRPDLPAGLPEEPDVGSSLAAGADLVLFSGDKLLGGPQAGILLGRADLVEACARDPLARAFRVDKLTLAAMEATLRALGHPDRRVAEARVPYLAMLGATVESLRARAERLAAALGETGDSGTAAKVGVGVGVGVEVAASVAMHGGGSAPTESIPSIALRLTPPFGRHGSDETRAAAALRQGRPPVVVRVQQGAILLDLRTIPPRLDGDLLQALRELLRV